MDKELVKLFSGTFIIVKGMQVILKDNNINCFTKNNVESARLSGFGTARNDVHLFVYKKDLNKAMVLVKEYQEKINS